MTTLETMRDYMGNNAITLDERKQVRLEETHQTLGQVFESEAEVVKYLRTLCLDEWHGIDVPELYEHPGQLRDGLTYLGDTVWYQRY